MVMAEPEVTFGAFVISLATSAAVHFGDIADSAAGQRQPPDLPAAKQMIDLLTLMELKTRGNLTPEETQLLGQVLYELRLRFVQAATAGQKTIIP
jgi:hypothetical protein